MFPSWLAKLKDVKGSHWHRKPSSYPPLDENPSALAKTFSLLRASSRAKSSRAQASTDSEVDPRRICKGVDAFDALSGFPGDEATIDAFAFNEFEKGDDNAPRADAHTVKVAASLIQGRIDRDQDLWDREFSSMSSYGSEQDALAVKAMRLASVNETVLKPIPAEEQGCTPACASDHEMDDFAVVLDTASSCSEISSTESVVSCKCGCEDHRWLEEERRPAMVSTAAKQEPSSNRKRDILSYRRKRSNSSISAVLPPDLRGVVGDSIALVKISHNPYEDFRESMYEMIMEKDLEGSIDMEELLYCYLSLNSPEHHQLIEEVFSDVWSAILMRFR